MSQIETGGDSGANGRRVAASAGDPMAGAMVARANWGRPPCPVRASRQCPRRAAAADGRPVLAIGCIRHHIGYEQRIRLEPAGSMTRRRIRGRPRQIIRSRPRGRRAVLFATGSTAQAAPPIPVTWHPRTSTIPRPTVGHPFPAARRQCEAPRPRLPTVTSRAFLAA